MREKPLFDRRIALFACDGRGNYEFWTFEQEEDCTVVSNRIDKNAFTVDEEDVDTVEFDGIIWCKDRYAPLWIKHFCTAMVCEDKFYEVLNVFSTYGLTKEEHYV